MKDSKSYLINFKTTTSEKKFLEERAASNGMNLSEFIRARLFEDGLEIIQEIKENPEQKNLTKFHKDLIKFTLGSYQLINRMAHKNFDTQTLQRINDETLSWLEKNGYSTTKKLENSQ